MFLYLLLDGILCLFANVLVVLVHALRQTFLVDGEDVTEGTNGNDMVFAVVVYLAYGTNHVVVNGQHFVNGSVGYATDEQVADNADAVGQQVFVV